MEIFDWLTRQANTKSHNNSYTSFTYCSIHKQETNLKNIKSVLKNMAYTRLDIKATVLTRFVCNKCTIIFLLGI